MICILLSIKTLLFVAPIFTIHKISNLRLFCLSLLGVNITGNEVTFYCVSCNFPVKFHGNLFRGHKVFTRVKGRKGGPEEIYRLEGKVLKRRRQGHRSNSEITDVCNDGEPCHGTLVVVVSDLNPHDSLSLVFELLRSQKTCYKLHKTSFLSPFLKTKD